MVDVILVCRMGSSRLPGKTLMDFGGISILEHIVQRIWKAEIPRARIVVCTSDGPADEDILVHGRALGCRVFAGSASNVSERILAAAAAFGIEDFILILGDNPWVDIAQIRSVTETAQTGRFDYVVTSTAELEEKYFPAKMYPIGTRLQFIHRDFMRRRLNLLDSEIVREHTSKLFAGLSEAERWKILSPDDGWSPADIGNLNISINTRTDYEMARRVLEKVGRYAAIKPVVECYRGNSLNA